MKKNGILALMLSAVMLFPVVLSGCGGPKDEAEPNPAQKVEEGTEPKTLTALVSIRLAPELCDTTYGSEADFRVYELMYDPLVRYGYDGKIEPALAERYEISEDGTRYTFYLRKDVKFSDGTEFNADNVMFNCSRWTDKTKENFSAGLEKVEKIDDYTVAFTFDRPAVQTLVEFTYPRPFRFLAESSLNEDGSFKLGVGTGQWMIESYETDHEVVYVPNPYYYGPKPKIDKIILKEVTDGQARTMALQSGDADICLTDLPASNAAIIAQDENLDQISVPSTQAFFLGINYDHPILQDVNVRQALNYGVNNEELVDSVLDGAGTPTNCVFSPAVPYVTEENSKGYPYDVEQAKALLAKSGYTDTDGDGFVDKNGEPLTLRLVFQSEEYTSWKTICEYLQSQYAKIGIKIDLQEREVTAYYDAIWSTRDYDLIIYRTYEDSWNPHGFLKSVFYQSEGSKSVFWYDEEFNEKLSAALEEQDDTKRQAIYDEIFTRMNDEAFTIPLYSPDLTYVYRTNVKNVEMAPTSYTGINFDLVDIEP